MHIQSQKLRITTVALSCLVPCVAATLGANAASAQATSPVVNQASGETDSWQHFTVEIPEGTSSLNVTLAGDNGDPDLYVRFGEQPTATDWDCRPFKEGGEETCTIAPPKAGTYHISVNGYSAYQNATVTTSWTAADKAEPPTKVEDWKLSVLERHNTLRADHCAAPLAWDEEVAASAQAWADQCKWEHAEGTGLGENLAGAVGATAMTTLSTRVDSWYSEIAQYDFANPGFSLDTGHFTQVVWRGTTKLGCGVKQCPASAFPWADGPDDVTFFVCRYAPGGNITGEYPQNVLPKPENGVCAQ